MLRKALLPLALLYEGVIRLRNRHYERPGVAQRVGVPVISVGNVTVGGTGKTPFVIEVVRMLCELGRRPAILTRGYAARPGQEADEVRELRGALPETPIVVNLDRVAGAAVATREHRADCLVLDDGFQHRRLARELDIVLVDALSPWAGGMLLPAGGLREPRSSLRRAGVIVITRANQAPAERVQALRAQIEQIAPRATCLLARVVPVGAIDSEQRTVPADQLADRGVLAACAIGNPRTFEFSLASFGLPPRDLVTFPDHHAYSPGDVERLRATAERAGAGFVVTTRKDWVKLEPLWPDAGGPALLRLEVRVELEDEAPLRERLKTALESDR